MKRLICCLIATFCVWHCFSQPLNDAEKKEAYDSYRKKAQKQRLSGLVLMGTGLITTGVCTAYALDNLFNSSSDDLIVPLFTGVGMTIAGIPFLLISDHNNRKAKALKTAFKMENAPSLANGVVTTNYYPSVSLKLKL